MPDLHAVNKRYVLLVSKECEHCEEAKKEFASKYFGYGEVIDIDSLEGQKLVRDHQVTYVPLELELESDAS